MCVRLKDHWQVKSFFYQSKAAFLGYWRVIVLTDKPYRPRSRILGSVLGNVFLSEAELLSLYSPGRSPLT